MVNQVSSTKVKFDLEERTLKFSEDVLSLVKKITIRMINENIVKQLLRSSSSQGANYIEATAAESKKDFIHKIGIARKEAKESMYWLRLLALVEEQYRNECRKLWKEAHELTLIFSAAIKTAKSNTNRT